jgi:hypothetical protein
MNERQNWGQIAGLVLHILIGGLMAFTGAEKVLGMVPPEALARYGLGEQVRLIGAGALLTALLLLIPRTSMLGSLLTSSFWGSAICTHMAHGEPYLVQAVLLVLTWAGAYLRNPATLSSFSGPPGITREEAAESEPAVPWWPGQRSGCGGPLTSDWPEARMDWGPTIIGPETRGKAQTIVKMGLTSIKKWLYLARTQHEGSCENDCYRRDPPLVTRCFRWKTS